VVNCQKIVFGGRREVTKQGRKRCRTNMDRGEEESLGIALEKGCLFVRACHFGGFSIPLARFCGESRALLEC
jgi:hypothetical protein